MEARMKYVIIPTDPDKTVQLRPYVDFRSIQQCAPRRIQEECAWIPEDDRDDE